ncbi:MAG TPA: GGDEF domain-containing protein [Vicinamibacteria bacterium]|nr:GGDEF domain-containing protein [Vicinamibacteria bacterium]
MIPEAERPEDEDLLARERARVMYALSMLTIVFLVPFAVNDFLKGRNLLGLAIVAVVGAFAADGYAIHRGRTPPVPYALLAVPIVAAIVLSVATQGVIGAFWCYPVVLFFYFVLGRGMARACSGLILLVAAAAVYRYLSVRITVRFAVSLFLTIVIVDIIQDIIRTLQRRLVDQAITDPLTGAFNRRHMETRLWEAVAAGRRRQAPAALLLIDIDHFKHINDRHGHKAGDQVLKGLVRVLRSRSRKVDHVFRMGGEEFVLLLPDTTEDDAVGVAEELREAIAHASLLDGTTVTASIGVAGLPPDDSAESWVKDADAAMYRAKEAGRNRVMRRAPAGAVR